MKLIGITQRSDTNNAYKEARDALDRRWLLLCKACELLPVPLPNCQSTVKELLKTLPFDGFILTGGNSLNDSLERDVMEKALLKHALTTNLPILGVCRGMQLIQDEFGIALSPQENHVSTKHILSFMGKTREVNSYHLYGTSDNSPEFSILAKAEDGIIEAIRHTKYPLAGIMWHPEREETFAQSDLDFMKNFWN